MPGPAAVFAVPAGLMAMKRFALQVSAYYCTPEVASAATVATLTTLVAKYIWAHIPEWIKQDISFRTIFWGNYKKSRKNRKNNNRGDDDATVEKDDNDLETREELTHLSSILQSIHRYTKSMEEGAVEIPQFHAAVLAYIQWSRTMKHYQILQYSQQQIPLQLTNHTMIPRDLGYETAGRVLDLEEEVRTIVHQEALEFATWAYHRDTNKLTRILHERNHKMMIHDSSNRPGFVAFYVAISDVDDKKQIVIGIRGTSTLEDLVTDCCGHAVPLRHDDGKHEERGSIEVEAEKPHEIRLSRKRSGDSVGDNHDDEESEDPTLEYFDQVEIVSGHERILNKNDDGDYHIRCHEGMLVSAQRLCRRIQSLVKNLAVDAEYQILLSGHSLGAGVATLAGLILRSQYPSIADRLQVFAFAPPPVLDHDSALASSKFVTSFVHNADLIPRCSLFNLAILLKGLRHIHERLNERGINPTGPKTTAAFIKHLFEKPDGGYLSDSSSDDDASTEPDENQEPVERGESKTVSVGSTTPLTTIEEWQHVIEAGTPDIRKSEHLFVAGRVLLVYSPWAEEAQNSKKIPLSGADTETSNEQEQEEKNVTLSGGSPSLMRCIETDGTSPALRGVEADSPRLFTDHVTSAYYEALGMDYHFD